MTAQFDDALQQILNLLQDGRIHDKRQLWRDLGRRGIDVSYMTLDMALDLLRRADLMRIVNVTTVQITDYGSRLLRDGLVITRESLQVPTKPSPSSTHDAKEVLPTTAHDQTTHHHHEQHQQTISALLADIMREFGKPLHFTKIFELALKKGVFRQLPNAKTVSTDTVFQALNNNSSFRSTGKGVFALTEWYDLRPVGKTSSQDNGKSSRVALFAQILAEVGEPLHCREIHGEALKRLPTKDHFPMNLAYISLYGSSRFHLLGDGVFALAEWTEDQKAKPTVSNEKPSRASLFAQILTDAGKPLHYRDIHQKALKSLPAEEHLPAILTRLSLQSNSRFHQLGDGRFTLAEWDERQKAKPTVSNEKPSRVSLFAQILAEAGKPLHYRDIHQKTLESLSAEEHFPAILTRLSLQSNSRFRQLSGGQFALAEWDERPKAKPGKSNAKLSRAALFAQILAHAGKPLHYRDIYQKALELLPAEKHFPANLAYISLHTSSRFQLLGDGVFALAEWDEDQKVNPVRPDEKPSRAALFAQILTDAGKPLHYRDIHQKALGSLSVEEHFPANLAYVSLYSSNRFQALGDGVFALAEWDEHQKVSPARPDEKPSRAALFAKILADASRPLHYRDIHQKALECLPVEEHFSDQLAYISLHRSSRFRLLGDGIYGLAEWEHVDRPYFEENGTRIFMICPRPLLPEVHHSRSLFESVVTGIRIAQYYPSLAAKQFLRHMAAWAQRRTLSEEEIWNAFDTWYVVGLLDRNDYHYNTDTSITISIDYADSLEQIRNHCLNSLCQRLEHTTTILYLIHTLPPMSAKRIQQFLRDQEGYRLNIEVAEYIEFLEAFEAVQRSGDEWRLTPIGENILQNNQPQELPDFSLIEEVTSETEDIDDISWEDELGLLDL